MFGWVLFALALTALLGVLTWLLSPGGRKWARKKRSQVWRHTGKVARGAWRARRLSTPRGRMRTERLKQPHRLGFGHRKPPDNDNEAQGSRTAKVAAKTGEAVKGRWEATRVAWANRRRTSLLELVTPGTMPADPTSVGLCGSTRTHDGRPCRNLRMIGRNYCHVHKPWFAA